MARKNTNTRIVTPSTPAVSENAPKRKGRPAGSIREIFVVCTGMYEDTGGEAQVGCEKFHIQSDKDATDIQLLSAGKKMFQAKFGVEPTVVLGPFFERKGKSSYTKKRDSVRIDIDDLELSGKSAKGVYNGWNVTVQYSSNHEDIGFVMFKNEVTPGAKPKAKPAAKPVYLKAIDIQS